MAHVLAHGGSTPMEQLAAGLLLALLAIGIVDGSILGVVTRHGKPGRRRAQPKRESVQDSWSGGSWERW